MARFLKIFIISFILIFAALNGRFLYADIKYRLGPGFALEQTQTPTSAFSSKPLPDSATLAIDKIGVSAPIIFGIGDDNAAILKSLADGVVHYSDTPKPGFEGVSIILGHSSAYPWYRGKYGSVFALLGKLRTGDKFSVRYADGRVFNFAVKQSLVFSPFAKDARLTEVEKTRGSSLVLISCWPIGTNYRRIAVQAELI